jgi:hypothetical protein
LVCQRLGLCLQLVCRRLGLCLRLVCQRLGLLAIGLSETGATSDWSVRDFGF